MAAVDYTGALWDNNNNVECRADLQGVNGTCGYGTCESSGLTQVCVCIKPYISVFRDGAGDWDPCSYKAKSKIAVFFISFFVGGFGVDWFYLARANMCYVCVGITKFITAGGCCIWGMIDVVNVIVGSFSDGNGAPLFNDFEY